MGFKRVKNDIRVEVEPRHPGNFGWVSISGCERSEAETISICESIVQDIKRHVDDIQDARVVYHTELVCEHCDSIWTEGEDSPHNGGCCFKDCEVYEREGY